MASLAKEAAARVRRLPCFFSGFGCLVLALAPLLTLAALQALGFQEGNNGLGAGLALFFGAPIGLLAMGFGFLADEKRNASEKTLREKSGRGGCE